MPKPAASVELTLRNLRTFHGTLMCTIILYVYVLSVIPALSLQTLSSHLPWELGIVAAIEIAIAVVLRMRRLEPAFEALRSNPDDVAALSQWRGAVITSDALAEGVVLYGVAIHFIGGTSRQIIPFFVAGSVLMILWWPRRPN